MKNPKVMIITIATGVCLILSILLAINVFSHAPKGQDEAAEKSAGAGTVENDKTDQKRDKEQEEAAKPEKETADTGKTDETALGKDGDGQYFGALQVKGASLCDMDGNPVQLKGVSTHGLAWFPQYVNETLIKELHDDWNANVIRLAMYTVENGGYCTDGDKAALKQLIADGVKYATDNDMYVIIDWHVLSDQNPNIHKEEAKEFFSEMSGKYADYENVLYEICNEPNGGTGWAEIKAYAEEVIPVIRQKDKDAVILVGTPNWSQFVDEAAKDPITGQQNIMYTLHFYAATHKEELRSAMVSAVEAGLPVFVSEYGICEADGNGNVDAGQADAWVETMNRYGISYVAWNLANKDEQSSIIKASCDKTSGFLEEELSEEGKWLYGMLTAENGKKPSDGGGAADSAEDGSPQDGKPQTADTPQDGTAKSADAAQTAVKEVRTDNGRIKAELEISGSWESEGRQFYQYTLTLTNVSQEEIGDWSVAVEFQKPVQLSDGWNGTYGVDGQTLEIQAMDYNKTIKAGDAVKDIGFIVSM